MFSAVLVGCLAFAVVMNRVGIWKVFGICAVIATLVYGTIAFRLYGDRPSFMMGLMLYFMIITALGVLLGLPILVWRQRRARREP